VPAPAPILQERWSLARAFTVTPVTGALFAFLLVLAVGLFVRMAWRTGRDRRFAAGQVDVVMGAPAGTPEQAVPLFESGGAPVEFAPPEDLRPGQIGTLMDEVANPLDVTATIVDLAVGKYLVIEEIPRHGLFGRADWRLKQLRAPGDDLLPYERRLLDGVFEDGDEVTLSSLRRGSCSGSTRCRTRCTTTRSRGGGSSGGPTAFVNGGPGSASGSWWWGARSSSRPSDGRSWG
jgi:Predicted membrane protein (DUF2207)